MDRLPENTAGRDDGKSSGMYRVFGSFGFEIHKGIERTLETLSRADRKSDSDPSWDARRTVGIWMRGRAPMGDGLDLSHDQKYLRPGGNICPIEMECQMQSLLHLICVRKKTAGKIFSA